jgi:hypothetical protein
MQKLKIDVKKIDKSLLFVGTKGTYLDVTLMENRNGPDEYGNDGFIVQDVSKEAREAGVKGPIIGNWKHLQPKAQSSKVNLRGPRSRPPVDLGEPDNAPDDIPF